MHIQKKIRVAILQFSCEDGAVEKNFSKLEALLARLSQSPQLILLPEMWPSGFRVLDGKRLLQETEVALVRLAAYARKFKSYIIGSHLSAASRGFYNSASVMDPRGKTIASYHKAHLFALGGEAKKFVAGDKVLVMKTRLGKMGLAICYDIRFPEFIRKEVLAGAELICIPSAWPLARIEHYRVLLRARAIENQCFILSSNKVGKNAEGIQYGGHSIALDPWGNVVGELKSKAGILELDLDLNRVKDVRKQFPVLSARRHKIY